MLSTKQMIETLRAARKSLDSGKGGVAYKVMMRQLVEDARRHLSERMKTESRVLMNERNEGMKNEID